MPLYTDAELDGPRTYAMPEGPALLYVTEGDHPTITILDQAVIDTMPRRDQLVCRALLEYVTEQLDAASPPAGNR